MLFIAGYSGGLTSTNSLETASEQQQPQKEVDPACIDDTEGENIKDSLNAEVTDLSKRYMELEFVSDLIISFGGWYKF